jgi:hypothetical protein
MNEQDLLLLLLLPYVKAYEHNSRSRNYKIEEELARKKRRKERLEKQTQVENVRERKKPE